MPDDPACTDSGCCCDTFPMEDGSDSIEFGDDRLDPDRLATRSAAFRLLLDTGQSADITAIARAADVDQATVTEVVKGFARTETSPWKVNGWWGSPG